MRLRQPIFVLIRAVILILAAVTMLALLGTQARIEAKVAGLESGTPFCGVIDADTVWTLSDSPYLITCNSEVAAGVTLTVQPGVVVKLDQAHLEIKGNLLAEGTEQQPITFTSAQANPAPGDWLRLWFSNAQGSSVLDHVVVEYAGRLSCGGIHFDAGTLAVKDSTVRYGASDGVRAIELTANSTLVVTGSDLSYNAGHGIRFNAQEAGVSLTASGNTLVGNGQYAISISTASGVPTSPVLESNTGSGNGTDGILLDVLLATATLRPNPGLPYVIYNLVTLPNSKLSVEAGAVFKADREDSANGSKIQLQGEVEIVGEVGNPVVFTSLMDDAHGGDTNRDGNASHPEPGDWRGLSIALPTVIPPLPDFDYQVFLPLVLRNASSGMSASNQAHRVGVPADDPSPQVVFDHVIVRYGGYDMGNLELFGGEAEISNTTIEHSAGRGLYAEDVQLKLTNSALRDNGTDGLWLYGLDVVIAPVLVNNEFSHNGQYGAYLIFNGGCHPTMEIRDNTGSDNGWVNGIYAEGYVDTPLGCHLGPNPQLPYVLWTITVSETGRLVIDPGTVVKFANPELERGSGTLMVAGTLQAVGSANAPIALTSFWDDTLGGDSDSSAAPPAPGDWIGLVIQPGAQAILKHTLVRYGGANGANLLLVNASLQLSDSEILNSADKGLAVLMEGAAQALVVGDNTFVGNVGYAISVRSDTPTLADFELAGNEGSGNGVNGILLDVTMDSMTVKSNPTLPYVIQSVTVAPGKTVLVEPGVVFKADQDYSGGGSLLAVDGELQVAGAANNRVYFTSLHDDAVGGDTLSDGGASQPGPGDWRGIVVREGGKLVLDHGVVRYGGSGGINLSATACSLHVTNSEIAYSAGKGLAVLMEGAAQAPVVRDNTFVGNVGYAISVRSDTPTLADFELAGNEGSGNGVNGILLDVTMDSMTVKSNPTLPYVIQSVTVAPGKTVLVEPGVVFKADQDYSGGGSLLAVDGALQVAGVANNRVYFTSLHDDTVGGDTLGDGGASQPGPGDWRGIDVHAGGEADLTYSVLQYAGSDNIGFLNVGGQVTLDLAQVLHNQGNGVANQQGGVLTVIHSHIAYNTGSGISNSADGTLTATYNDIVGNQGYGVYSSRPLGDYSPVKHNYWGSVNGPAWDGNYCSNPPQGSGEFVTCHNLLWEPFATAPYFP